MSHHSGLTLAYLGDAVYELLIRKHFIAQGLTKVDDLHQATIAYTSAEGQASAYHAIKDQLTNEELTYFKRGRNAKSDRKARSASLSDYRLGTGLEALFGALYLAQQEQRINALLHQILSKQGQSI